MGNANKFVYFHSTNLLHPVDDSLSFLTKLTAPTISLLLNRYKTFFLQKTYISSQEFKRLTQNTGIQSRQMKVLEKFSPSFNTINVFEFFSVIITYSELNWQSKVSLLFKIFDFDKSKLLTKDELIILSKCFLKGIQTLTNKKFQLPFAIYSSSIHESIFERLDFIDGISLHQLTEWVKSQRTLLQLFKQNSKKKSVTEETPKIFSKTFDRTCEINIRTRRFSMNRSSVERESRKDYLKKIFFQACNRMQVAQAGNLYNQMTKEPMLAVEAEIFFRLFSFKLKTELNLPEFLKVCKQIKEKRINSIRDSFSVKERRKSKIDSSKESKAKKAVILKIFDNYDSNGDGVLSVSELKNGMKDFLSPETAKELFKEFDLDQSNTLDRKEFLKLFDCKK